MTTVSRVPHPFRGHFQRRYGVLSKLILVVAFVFFSFMGGYLYPRLPVYQQFVQTTVAQDQRNHSYTKWCYATYFSTLIRRKPMQSLLIVALCQALFVGQVPILLTLFLAGLSQCLLGDRNGHCLWILWVARRKECGGVEEWV